MRELYNSEPNLVTFTTSVRGRPERPAEVPVVELFTGSENSTLKKVADLTANEIDNGVYEFAVPHTLLRYARVAAVDVSYELDDFGPVKMRKGYEVAKRLMDYDEMNNSLEEEFRIDYEKFSHVEADIRRIIESYCNQSFNSWQGTRVINSSEGHIMLPEYLEKLDSVTVGSSAIPGYAAPLSNYSISEGGLSISNPDRERTVSFFHGSASKVNYTITGTWGYTSVPSAVNQAAMELAKGFLCDDIEYRRRYIDNIRAADTRIEFHDNAYADSTGNPIADQILQPYRFVQFGWV